MLLVPPMKHDGGVNAIAFSPDGARVMTGSSDNSARLWNASAGSPLGKPMRHDLAVRSVAFSPIGKRVVSASEDRTARLWNADTGEALGAPMQHDDDEMVYFAAFMKGPGLVVTIAGDPLGSHGSVRSWNAETGSP